MDGLSTDDPDELIAAHFTLMSARFDDVTTIVFSQAMADLFAADARRMKPAFLRARKNQFMTRIVLGRRLASRYFHEGRRRLGQAATATSGAWLLDRSLRLNVSLLELDDRATPNVKSMTQSQIATSSAHISRAMARDDPRRVPLLRSGLVHSSAAERNGDLSPDHDGYAIELALRLHEVTGEDTFARVAGPLTRARDVDSATLQGLIGDVEFAKAAAVPSHEADRAMSHLIEALDRYNRAVALPRDDKGADIGYLLAKRGRCYAFLYERGGDAVGRRDTTQLNRALADWLDPRTAPHRHDHEVARLLLARARLATARSDTAAAIADVSAAAELMSSQDRPLVASQLEGQTLGTAIEDALDHNDLDAVIKAAASAASLPPSTPVPAGSMTKSALWLQGRLTRSDWEQLAEPMLDRIEIDGAHPALLASGRGHVAGHAARLARALYLTDPPEPAGVLRAVELSRAHVSSAQTVSAAALDGASRAAYAYARLSPSADDVASEDDLGIWIDALLWGLSALQAEQTIQTRVEPAFDTTACALRLVDCALQLSALTGERSYLTTAADGLMIAGALTPDVRLAAGNAKLAAAQQPQAPARASKAPIAGNLPTIAPDQPQPVLTAWRSLSDADRLTGEAARIRRQEAACQFCELTVAGDASLGGKQRPGRRGVTTIQDPHRIAQQLVVLKRVDRAAAQREFAAITQLNGWLANSATPRGWSVPEPLGVVDVEDPEDSVFVMRRQPGHTLSHHAMEYLDGRAPNPQRMFEAAAQALGDFHTAMRQESATAAEDVTQSFRRAARQLASVDAADAAAAELAPVLASPIQLAKKDAHSGNWLWSTVTGGLIMIDVEGSTTRPVVLELATLIDDLPLFSLDPDGWNQRVRIGEHYLAALPPQLSIGQRELRHRLEAGALNVAVVGMARLLRRTWGTSSRGIRFAQLQHGHYRQLSTHLATAATNDSVRRAAAALSEQV
ncbi:hypothetical protein [Microlunatus phosphovorus]|nr:hypothetical protein [Microlunatus phosphovorus]